MAYLKNVDTAPKVGFRIMHETDPFGAAHLSGYGSSLGQGHNPFTPEAWTLHTLPPWRCSHDATAALGLGEYFYNRPFDASGWELYSDTNPGLHGLGDDASSLISIDPTTLLIGIGFLAAGMFLFGGQAVPKMRKRRAAQLRKKRDALSREIGLLEA